MVDGKVIKRAKHKSTIKDPGTPGILEMVNSFIKPLHILIDTWFCISIYILPVTHTLTHAHTYVYMCMKVHVRLWFSTLGELKGLPVP